MKNKKNKKKKPQQQVHELLFFSETNRWFIQWHNSYLPFIYGNRGWQVLPELNSCSSAASNPPVGLARGTNEQRCDQRPVVTSTELSCRHLKGLLQVPTEGLLAEVLVLSKLNRHYQSTVKWKIKEDSRGLSWRPREQQNLWGRNLVRKGKYLCDTGIRSSIIKAAWISFSELTNCTQETKIYGYHGHPKKTGFNPASTPCLLDIFFSFRTCNDRTPDW